MPEPVQDDVGFALYVAQEGGKHADAKPLQGFGGASVLEIVERYAEAVYVLHVFQKKSRSGIGTSQSDIELIKARLRVAERDYREWIETKTSE